MTKKPMTQRLSTDEKRERSGNQVKKEDNFGSELASFDCLLTKLTSIHLYLGSGLGIES